MRGRKRRWDLGNLRGGMSGLGEEGEMDWGTPTTRRLRFF